MKTSESLLTRIDAYILRSFELETDLTHKVLAERILNRYGVDIDIQERLNEYTPPESFNPFIYWN